MAAPGDVLFNDNFNRSTLAPWTTSNGARSGILTGAQTSSSGSSGGFTRNATVTVTSPTINAAVPAARLQLWIRRGSDAFSEDTDAGEDFVIEYRNSSGVWTQLRTFLGSGINGEIIQPSISLPPGALHGALNIRFRQTNGSGFNFDYWHFDDVVVIEQAPAPALSVGSCDDFENGLSSNWAINSSGGLAGTSAVTSSSPSNSMFLNGGVVNVTSNAIDTSSPLFADVSVWIRRGSDTFSENPDGGENLVAEYLNSSNVWVALETFSGAGGQGQIFNRTYTMPTAARHANFRLRLRMTSGSGTPFDFWHIDDVCLNQNSAPIIQVTKVATTLSDPINGSSGPLPIPGAFVQYTIAVSNQGIGGVDTDSMVITDPLPANTALFVSTVSGDPISFVDGTPSSGLTYSYPTNVAFSNQVGGGPPFDYTPTPDADGFDAAITGYAITPNGAMNPSAGAGDPNFTVVFRVRIQ